MKLKLSILAGIFLAGIQGNGKKRLQHCSFVRSFYSPGTLKWEVSDSNFKGLKIRLEVLSFDNYVSTIFPGLLFLSDTT